MVDVDIVIQRKLVELMDVIERLRKELEGRGLRNGGLVEEIDYDVGYIRQLYDRYRRGELVYSIVVYVIEKKKDRYKREYERVVGGYGKDIKELEKGK